MFKRIFSLWIVLTAILTLLIGCRDSFAVSAEQAKSIALADAGLTADQVTWLRTNLERDDGRTSYDISFYQGDTEYEYEIDAVTGAILKANRDRDDRF